MDKLNNQECSSPAFWDSKYQNNDTGWDIGEATPIFINWSKSLEFNQKILVPGAGNGHDALYLASLNHEVYALDFSKNAINNIKNQASEKSIIINTICKDFFNLHKTYNNYFDVILEYTFFCAIPINKRSDYIKKIYNLLKSNGIFVGILLPVNKPLSQGGPPYGINIKRTISDFKKYFNILEINKSPISIPPRKDNEVFIVLSKKQCL